MLGAIVNVKRPLENWLSDKTADPLICIEHPPEVIVLGYVD